MLWSQPFPTYDTGVCLAMGLWTNSVLHGARRIYEREGSYRTRSESHGSYRAEFVAEDWDLEL